MLLYEKLHKNVNIKGKIYLRGKNYKTMIALHINNNIMYRDSKSCMWYVSKTIFIHYIYYFYYKSKLSLSHSGTNVDIVFSTKCILHVLRQI